MTSVADPPQKVGLKKNLSKHKDQLERIKLQKPLQVSDKPFPGQMRSFSVRSESQSPNPFTSHTLGES